MRRLLPAIQAAALLIGLAACSSGPNDNALNYTAISLVEAEIKREVAVYMAATRLPPMYVDDHGQMQLLPTGRDDYACGSGQISFDILNVKADLLATTETIIGGDAGVASPFPGGTVGISGGGSNDNTNTQDLVYNLWFDPTADQPQVLQALSGKVNYENLKQFPIANAIISLRNSLLASNLKIEPGTNIPRPILPCHWDWNQDFKKPGGDPGDTMKFAVTVLRDRKAGGKLTIYLVNLDLSDENKRTNANTITVSFYQTGTLNVKPDSEAKPGKIPKRSHLRGAEIGRTFHGKLPVFQATPDALNPYPCKGPDDNTQACLRARGIGQRPTEPPE